MNKTLPVVLDRSAKTPLAEQIRSGISAAIESGALTPGARLPSWIDLAAQLGVSRGTVRAAYERLMDAQLIVASRANGTRVTDRPSKAASFLEPPPDPGSFMGMQRELTAGPGVFQMGVPAQELVPTKLFSLIRSFIRQAQGPAFSLHPDPRGEMELRQEVAAYVAVARGLRCSPAQIFITSGFSGGLGAALRVLRLEGSKVWVENPGFPFTRHGLEKAGLHVAAIPVDIDGLNIDYGMRHEPDAALVVTTPGQQAPLGVTLSLERRLRLLDWANEHGAWIIEDDYLGELQLQARAAPALASLDRAGRVIHLGSFSKTISPALRLGFIVAPVSLTSQFAEIAACLAPAPWQAVQLAMGQFMREGHYMRHLRRAKRLYGSQRNLLIEDLKARGVETTDAGLAVLLKLPDDAPDTTIARDMLGFGLAPAPLSPWYHQPGSARSGLLLGVASAPKSRILTSCDRLCEVLQRRLKND